jgi:hypothetical protein
MVPARHCRKGSGTLSLAVGGTTSFRGDPRGGGSADKGFRLCLHPISGSQAPDLSVKLATLLPSGARRGHEEARTTTLSDKSICRDKRVIVTPAVYPRLLEFLHVDIQSTGQKSHCVNTRWGHRNALF